MILDALQSTDWFFVALWGIIFVVTLIIELETMDLTTIWFCVSSLITLICGVTFAPPYLQVIIFISLSVILIVLTRPLTKKMMKTEIIRTNTDRVVGMIAIVTKEIVPNEIGEVKVENSFWRAINNDNLSFKIGEKVIVDAIVGIKLVVSKLDDSSSIELIEK